MATDSSSRKFAEDKEQDPNRIHHKTTILTVDKSTYDCVRDLRPGEERRIEFCNDVVSSAAGGSSVDHHTIRRIDLIRRQIYGGFLKVMVRYEPSQKFGCRLVPGTLQGRTYGCTAFVTVRIPREGEK